MIIVKPCKAMFCVGLRASFSSIFVLMEIPEGSNVSPSCGDCTKLQGKTKSSANLPHGREGKSPYLLGGFNPFEKYARQFGLWIPKDPEWKLKNLWNHHLATFDMTPPVRYWSSRSILPNRDDFRIAIRSTSLSNKMATKSITGSESRKARTAAPL